METYECLSSPLLIENDDKYHFLPQKKKFERQKRKQCMYISGGEHKNKTNKLN
jgi:hypothetical protein